MGLNIWLKDDVANVLRAANEANLSAMWASDCGFVVEGSGEAARKLHRASRRGFVAVVATLTQPLGLPVTESDREPSGAAPETRLGRRDRHPALPTLGVGGQECEE
jgi:hypothetical protein